jgi:uncharacterized protein (DUF362 family)
MKRGDVAIQRGKKITQTVKRTLQLLGGLGRVIRNGDRVVISPNYGVPMKSDSGATTNPEVVVSVIEAAKEAGAKKVIVGESSVVGFDAGKVMAELGVQRMFEQAGAEVLNFDEDQKNVVEKKIPRGKLLKKIKIFRPAAECDVLISVPVLKTHIYAGVSLGMKNLKGTLPDAQKKLFHRVGARKKTDEQFELDRCISDMMIVHHPDFTVIDGMIGQEGFVLGQGVCGTAVKMNTIIAGTDFVAVDAVGAYIMGFDPLKINHIRYCSEMGLGEADLTKIAVLGEDLDAIRREFRPAIPGELGTYENVRVIEGGSCSGCSLAIRWALNAFEPEKIHKWDKAVFFVGSEIEPPDKIDGRPFLIGKCACRQPIENAVKVTGCPPPFFHIVDEINQATKRN